MVVKTNLKVGEYPNIILGNDPDITDDCLSTQVTLPENGISQCIVTANNELGKNYLAHYKLFDEVIVKYAYDEDNPDWDTLKPVFIGSIIELIPSMSRSGEILSVTAINIGFCLKQMRVAQEYGIKTNEDSENLNIDNTVDAWVLETNQWTHIGVEPWLNTDDVDNYISLACNDGTKGYCDSYWNFINLDPKYKLVIPTLVKFYIKARAVLPTLRATLRISIWDGIQWVLSDEIDFQEGEGWVEKEMTCADGEWEDYFWTLEKINNARLRINFIDYNTEGGVVQVTYARIHVEGIAYWWNTLEKLRDILTDTDYGMITRYVEKILNTEVNSGYSLNTDYVYDYENAYSYLNFPYQDAFMCMQDLMRLGSSVDYIYNGSNYKGLHWIITPVWNGDTPPTFTDKLCIAPVGDHNVYGKDGSYHIEDAWATRMANEPLVVREDMITQNFKTEIPLANYVLVAGKYICPVDDIWTENIGGWEFQCSALIAWQTVSKILLDNVFKIRGCSLNTRLGKLASGAEYQLFNVFLRPLNTEFLNLITRDSSIKIAFRFAVGGSSSDWKFRLLVDKTHYIEYNLDAVSGHPNEFISFEPEITVDTLKGLDPNWTLVSKGTDFLDDGMYDWDNIWDDIQYIGFHFNTDLGTVEPDCWEDDIMIIGNIIRGAYDSVNIGLNKCRFLTIKDSLASTDSLDPDDDTSPLAQLALYELLRNRIVKTSGQISIPLDPTILPGQLVHIHAGFNPDYVNPDTGSHYEIDKDFRITEVRHNFIPTGATTLLKLVDDLKNSIPIDTMDPYSITMRAINPDYQTRTYASLKTGGDFISQQIPISKDYPTS